MADKICSSSYCSDLTFFTDWPRTGGGRRCLGLLTVLLAAIAPHLAGCFQETSFPLRPGDYRRIAAPASTPAMSDTGSPGTGSSESTRQWLVRTAGQLAPLLEPEHRRYMTTEDMADERGRPRDVYAFLDRPERNLNNIFLNYYGFLHTVQGANQGWATGEDPPAWPSFEQVWIKVADNVELSGRRGLAESGGVVQPADCIVLLRAVGRQWRDPDPRPGQCPAGQRLSRAGP